MAKNPRDIKYIIVHCTDSDDSLDIGFREIDQWHNERGWLSGTGISCGYHYVVRRSGKLEKGRPDWEVGAHVKGWNKNSIGIVWVGKKDIAKDQYHTLMATIRGLMNQYRVPVENVLGHCEIDHLKTCPNLHMLKLRANLVFFKAEDIDDQIKVIMKL